MINKIVCAFMSNKPSKEKHVSKKSKFCHVLQTSVVIFII